MRLDWPIPQAPKKYKGVVLSTLQQSNLIWLAKGDREQVPPSLEGLDRTPVRVKVAGIGFVTFKTALANLVTPGNRKWRRANDKQKRALVSSLNDQFLEAAFSRLVGLPGNEKVGRAAKDIEGLKDRWYVMTISTTNITKSYNGNGSTHSFAYDFPIFMMPI